MRLPAGLTPSSAGALLRPVLILAIFVLDRVTKSWAMERLLPLGSVRVLPFFRFTYIENSGAAWGMFRGGNKFLILVAVVLLVVLLRLRRRWPESNRWAHYGLALVAGGALGNLYDRIVLGFVVDFLDFLVWPVFNVADSCITVGACSLAWGLHQEEKQRGKDEARPEG